MRWSRLFADLDSQVDAVLDGQLEAEVAERTRMEVARLRIVDRLRAAEGHPIEAHCAGAGLVHGRLDRVGADWLLLCGPPAGETLVRLGAVLAVTGLGRTSAPPGAEGRIARALGLRHALSGLARDRCPVRVVLTDGVQLAGTVDRVGADFLELAEHAPGEPRRATSVLRVRTVPFAGIGSCGRGEDRQSGGSGSSRPSGCVCDERRVSAYMRSMYDSSCSRSTRHCPRPPILIAGSAPLRTSA